MPQPRVPEENERIQASADGSERDDLYPPWELFFIFVHIKPKRILKMKVLRRV